MSPLEFTPRRRHLVRFSPKRVAHVFTDVLVIGGGIAGLRAVLALEAGVSAVVVTKDLLKVSNSAQAQGSSRIGCSSTAAAAAAAQKAKLRI